MAKRVAAPSGPDMTDQQWELSAWITLGLMLVISILANL